MPTDSAIIEGSKRGAAIQKQKWLDLYYENPSICKNCGQIIEVQEGQKPNSVRVKKFCDRSCAAQYNNREYPKRHAVTQGTCQKCGIIILFQKHDDGYYRRRKLCDTCRKKPRTESDLVRTSNSTGTCKTCGKEITFNKVKDSSSSYTSRLYCKDCLELNRCLANRKRLGVDLSSNDVWLKKTSEMTKGELKSIGKHQYHYKTAITRHARKTYDQSNKPKCCYVCGYSKHIDIAHKKAVADFPDDAKVKEINDIENLVALCKTHHWEFDQGELDLETGILQNSCNATVGGFEIKIERKET